jgi:hypothetical protein
MIAKKSPADWTVALIGAGVVLIIVPGIREYATAPKWCFLAVSVALALCFTKVRMTACHAIGLCLMIWATLTLLWAPVTPDALQGLAFLFVLAGAFLLGAAAASLRLTFGLMSLACLPTLIAMTLVRCCGVSLTWQGAGGFGGTFGNSNFAGEAAAAAAIGAAVPLGAIAFAVVALSACRGALVGFVTMCVIWLWRSGRWDRRAWAVLFVSLCVVGAVATLSDPIKREAVIQRSLIWRDTYDGLTVFGRGIGQYRATVPDKGHRLAALELNTEHAHNDILEIAFELGLPGVALFGFFLLSAYRRGMAAERYVMGSLLVAGLFGFPLCEPASGFLFAVVAGHCARARADLRDGLDECASDAVARSGEVAAILAAHGAASGDEDISAGLEIAPCGRGLGAHGEPMVAAADRPHRN